MLTDCRVLNDHGATSVVNGPHATRAVILEAAEHDRNCAFAKTRRGALEQPISVWSKVPQPATVRYCESPIGVHGDVLPGGAHIELRPQQRPAGRGKGYRHPRIARENLRQDSVLMNVLRDEKCCGKIRPKTLNEAS